MCFPIGTKDEYCPSPYTPDLGSWNIESRFVMWSEVCVSEAYGTGLPDGRCGRVSYETTKARKLLGINSSVSLLGYQLPTVHVLWYPSWLHQGSLPRERGYQHCLSCPITRLLCLSLFWVWPQRSETAGKEVWCERTNHPHPFSPKL